MPTSHGRIRGQFSRYLSPEDLKAAGDGPILEYLRTKYGPPEENAVAEDVTDHVFNVGGRAVHVFERRSSRELFAVGGAEARQPCKQSGTLIATMGGFARGTAGFLPGPFDRTQAIANAVAVGLAVKAIQDFNDANLLCQTFCDRDCTCVTIPVIVSLPEVTFVRFLGIPVGVRVEFEANTYVFCY
jgi:hypothetical protein